MFKVSGLLFWISSLILISPKNGVAFLVHQQCQTSMGSIKKKIVPVADALHFARGVHSIKLVNTEWHVGFNDDEWDLVRNVWWLFIDGINELTNIKNYTVSVLEMRLVGKSNTVLSTLNQGNFPYYITIEVLGNSEYGVEFDKASNFLSKKLTDFLPKGRHMLFHWPKNWPKDSESEDQVNFLKSKFPQFKELMNKAVGEDLPLYQSSNNIYPKVFDSRTKALFDTLWKST